MSPTNRTPHRRHIAALALLPVLAFGSACGGDDSGGTGTAGGTPSGSPAATGGSPPASSPSGTGDGSAKPVPSPTSSLAKALIKCMRKNGVDQVTENGAPAPGADPQKVQKAMAKCTKEVMPSLPAPPTMPSNPG